MKRGGIAGLVGVCWLMIACGNSSPQNINGSWSAVLLNPDRSTAFAFSADLTQAGGSTVNVSNFSFGTQSSCFANQTGQSATFVAKGNSNGVETGSFTMTVTTLFPTGQNVLAVNGIRGSNGSIAGTWTLTGFTGCSGNGSFTMNG